MLSKIKLESDEKSSATVRNVHVFTLKLLQTAMGHSKLCSQIKRMSFNKRKPKINNVTCKFIFPSYFDETGKITNNKTNFS